MIPPTDFGIGAKAIPYSLHEFSKGDGQGKADVAQADHCNYIHGVHILFICQS
jgi:hypothetical protein